MILVILQFNIHFREVVLGEYQVGRDPDCTGIRRQSCAPPKITRKVGKTIIHEGYHTTPPFPNDIALIRLDESVPLFQENPGVSFVMPVCLPWNENNPGNNLIQGDKLLVPGWGRITNNKITNYLRHKVSTRTLQRHYVTILGKDCSTQEDGYLNIRGNESDDKKFDFTKQFCAGGEIRKCPYSSIITLQNAYSIKDSLLH